MPRRRVRAGSLRTPITTGKSSPTTQASSSWSAHCEVTPMAYRRLACLTPLLRRIEREYDQKFRRDLTPPRQESSSSHRPRDGHRGALASSRTPRTPSVRLHFTPRSVLHSLASRL